MSSQKSNISEKQQLLDEIAELRKKLALVESRIAILDSESEPAVEPAVESRITILDSESAPVDEPKKTKSKSAPAAEPKKTKSKSSPVDEPKKTKSKSSPAAEPKKSKKSAAPVDELILPQLELVDEPEVELVAEPVPEKTKAPKEKAPKEKAPKEKAPKEKAPKAEKKSGELTMQQLKSMAKDLDVKGYTTLSREQLECTIKIPTVTFNAKKLSKWIDTIKEDQTLIFFVSNGDLGFSIKENTKNIFFADRCNTKEKNFNEVHSKRFLQGDDDILDMSKKFINNLKETLKECETSYFLSIKHFDDEQIKFYQTTAMPTLKDIN